MTESHDYDHDPRTHRAEEADQPTSVERVPSGTTRSGELDQAGGQAGLQEVDDDLALGGDGSGAPDGPARGGR